MRHNKSTAPAREDWCTPLRVVELLNDFGPVRLDPCSNHQSIVGAPYRFYADGLESDWNEDSAGGLIYANPPFGASKITPWITKAANEASRGAEIILMSPASVDTKWFRPLWKADALCFVAGRLTFLGAPASATFPVSLAYWGNRRFRFASVFEALGHVVIT